MNFNKKKRNYLIPALSIFCLVYIIFSMRPTGNETHFTPEWTENITHIRNTSPQDELIPYKLRDKIGYFTKEGKICCLVSAPFKSTISNKWYCTYNASNEKADIFFAD